MRVKTIQLVFLLVFISLSMAGESSCPVLELRSIDGAVHSSKNLSGKAIFFTFFARTCKPCQEEAPLLNALQAQYKDTLVIVGVPFKEDDVQKIRNLADEWHIKYIVCPDTDGNVARAFDVHELPRGFLRDHRGALITSYKGMTKENESDLKKRLANLQYPIKRYQANGPVFHVLPFKESNQEAAGQSKIWKSRIEDRLRKSNILIATAEKDADYLIGGSISMHKNITGIEITINHFSGRLDARFSDSFRGDEFTRLIGALDENISQIPFADRRGNTVERNKLIKIVIALLLLILANISGVAETEKKHKVVVYTLDAQGVEKSFAEMLTNLITDELSQSQKIEVRDEKSTIAILKEQGLAQSGHCGQDTCRIDTAKLIKADLIILGSIGKTGGGLHLITIRVADVNGTTAYPQKQTCKSCSDEELISIVEQMARNIRTFLETGKRPEGQISAPPPPSGPSGPTPPVTPSAGSGSISITTNPPGADIFLDSTPMGKTPKTLTDVPTGTHQLTLVMEGYTTLNKGVEIRAGQNPTVSEILVRLTGTIEVSSVPSGANVWIDGKYIGKCPQKLQGAGVGKHTVKMTLPDYQDYSGELTVEPNATATASATFQGMPGKILVTSTPSGAEVHIDGNKAGATPYSGQLASGNHQVRVGKDGYQSAEETVSIQPNKAKTLDLILKKGPDVRGDMVQVPAGEFTMGSNDYDNEKPPHRVYIDAFYIDKYDVTVQQYQACVQAGRCTAAHFDDGSCYVYSGGSWKQGTLPQSFRGGNQPVVCVDWNESKAYCEWAGKRLPTEAEWEKAARGTDVRKYPWGNQEPTCDLAVFDSGGKGCGKESTWPVGSKPNGASPYGAMDMAGNVWQWVGDWYDGNYYKNSPNRNPTGPSSGSLRVLRGGSWNYYDALNLRTSNRYNYPPDFRYFIIGFRCSRTP